MAAHCLHFSHPPSAMVAETAPIVDGGRCPNNMNRLQTTKKEWFVSVLIYLDHNMVFTIP